MVGLRVRDNFFSSHPIIARKSEITQSLPDFYALIRDIVARDWQHPQVEDFSDQSRSDLAIAQPLSRLSPAARNIRNEKQAPSTQTIPDLGVQQAFDGLRTLNASVPNENRDHVLQLAGSKFAY